MHLAVQTKREREIKGLGFREGDIEGERLGVSCFEGVREIDCVLGVQRNIYKVREIVVYRLRERRVKEREGENDI